MSKDEIPNSDDVNSEGPNVAESESDEADGWAPCAAGEVAGMVERLQSRRDKASTVKTIGGAVLVLLCAAVWMAFPATENNYGHISCSEVCKHADAYRDGSMAKSDPELLVRIEKHLDHCGPCAAKFKPATALTASFNSRIRLPIAVSLR